MLKLIIIFIYNKIYINIFIVKNLSNLINFIQYILKSKEL